MMRARIRLDTTSDVEKFVQITGSKEITGRIVIKDSTGLCVNAKSILGALHAMEFSELWLESENDYWVALQDFIIIEPPKSEE